MTKFASRNDDNFDRAIGTLEQDMNAAAVDLPPLEGAWKFDAGKSRIDLVAPEFVAGTAEILGFGAAKYGERNWEKGMSWSRAYAALMRHMFAWWAGYTNDDETGKSHLWHAACCLMFLVAFEARSEGTDDRPRKAA